MYIPRANEETRLPVLHALMRAHPLASLVSVGENGLFGTHLPMVVVEDPDGQGLGTLQGHISRANPQWRKFIADVDALAIFAGPQHYISASWYPGKLEDGEEVPTWNYAVVHASGPLRIVEDPDWLLAHLTSLTDIHEAASAEPWKVSDAPPDFIRTQMRGIVGLELPIRKLEGKWKVSQNRNERDRQAVVDELDRLGTADAMTMRGLVERK